ncbi:ACP S-malonyltransferase [Nocardia sp. 2]|uniref:Malonyl CoA-acyl carrier protein transacylase n=1 Tax=Nocardia acididurans TaxID=2802282 RepID=A0ABS1M782_9NOCA|nr:ACP S-malonyltransferase [Nocardia acididurans]MBL1076441.1 ACP S-malonyltransferase [Nocardia acididurans]
MTSSLASTTSAVPSRTRRVLAMFPGQGSQRAGMAAHLIEEYADAARVFDRAGELLGVPLAELCTTGSVEDLTPTEVAQPAIAVTGLATYGVLRSAGVEVDAVAGHSLGEYAALVAAGVLGFDDAVRLIGVRGTLMARVAQRTPGVMVAVSGLEAEVLERLCAETNGIAEVGNYNEPHQSVLSGESAAVRAVAERARTAGAERIVELRVDAPFHCSLMRVIEAEFTAATAEIDFSDPVVPLFSSVTGAPVTDGPQARALLCRQLAAPVRWVAVLGAAARAGITDYLEVGPGRVLSGLTSRTVAEPTVRSTNDGRRLAAVVRAYR